MTGLHPRGSDWARERAKDGARLADARRAASDRREQVGLLRLEEESQERIRQIRAARAARPRAVAPLPPVPREHLVVVCPYSWELDT